VEAAVVDERREDLTVLQYQLTPPRQIVPVNSMALWFLELGARRIAQKDWAAALAELARADSAQADKDARLFTSLVAGKRALALVDAQRFAAADSEAVRSLTLWSGNDDARYALVGSALRRGDLQTAEANLEPMVRAHPRNAQLRQLLEETRRALAGANPPR
jgi:Flp pilus assembly protein TadD